MTVGHESSQAPATRAVRLNVGGVEFCTTRETLCTDAHSMLAAMFSGARRTQKIIRPPRPTAGEQGCGHVPTEKDCHACRAILEPRWGCSRFHRPRRYCPPPFACALLADLSGANPRSPAARAAEALHGTVAGDRFRHVLNYLRSGTIFLQQRDQATCAQPLRTKASMLSTRSKHLTPSYNSEQARPLPPLADAALLEEADYFGLAGMRRVLEDEAEAEAERAASEEAQQSQVIRPRVPTDPTGHSLVLCLSKPLFGSVHRRPATPAGDPAGGGR